MAKTIAWKVFGLDISISSYHLLRYEYRLKWISRFMHFENLLDEIKEVDGVIVECGVGPGRSLFDFSVISEALEKPRHIYGFDTFEGLPAPTSEDGEWNVVSEGFWNNSQEQVREQLALAGLKEDFISSNITLVKGEFSQSLHWETGPIALLHLDCDIYESYKVSLERLYTHVAPGGIIAFDEYRLDHWPGATRAIDEFFEDKPEIIVQSPVAEQYYTIKR